MTLWCEWFPMEMIMILRNSAEIDDMSDKKLFLNSIEILDMSELRLAVVPPFVKEMDNLKRLNLSNNFIKGDLDGSVFPSNVEYIDLSNNWIESFSFENFKPSSLKSLRELDLSQNKLKSFPKEVELSVSLSYLNLGHNKIEEVDRDVRLPSSLYSLNLESNGIKDLRAGRYGVTKCMYLNLSGNELTSLSPTLLRGKVGVIDITNNNIMDWDFLSIAKEKDILIFS